MTKKEFADKMAAKTGMTKVDSLKAYDAFLSVASDYLKKGEGADGLIMTMTADDPKWSYINYDKDGFVTDVKEKIVISDEATVGIYNYAKGSDFVKYAKEMIAADERVNGEFYVAPVYNRMIAAGKKFVYYNVGSEANGMYGLGIPEDLDLFLKHPVSEKVK